MAGALKAAWPRRGAGSTRNPCPKGKCPRRCKDLPAFAAIPRLGPPTPEPLGGAERLGAPANVLLMPGPEGTPVPWRPQGRPGRRGCETRATWERGHWPQARPSAGPCVPGLEKAPYTQHPHGHLPSGGTRGPHEPPLTRSFCWAVRAGTAPARPAQRNPRLAAMRAPRTRAHLADTIAGHRPTGRFCGPHCPARHGLHPPSALWPRPPRSPARVRGRRTQQRPRWAHPTSPHSAATSTGGRRLRARAAAT